MFIFLNYIITSQIVIDNSLQLLPSTINVFENKYFICCEMKNLKKVCQTVTHNLVNYLTGKTATATFIVNKYTVTVAGEAVKS